MKSGKLMFGVGINDTKGRIGVCPFYIKWKNMLSRCYSESYSLKSPTYAGCSVCEEWLTFSRFKAWMQTQDWENKQLDKDLLYLGNKVYSPETCIFISQKINNFITEKQNSRGKYPIGVTLDQGKYKAKCCYGSSGSQKSLGVYTTPEDAHRAWLSFKLEQAHLLASEEADDRVSKALISRYENYVY